MIPTLMGDFEGIKASAKKVTAGAVEITRELELEMESRAGGGREEGEGETNGESSVKHIHYDMEIDSQWELTV